MCCVHVCRSGITAAGGRVSVQMREWTEVDMSFSAGGFGSSSDVYANEPLQFYGKSTDTFYLSSHYVLLISSINCNTTVTSSGLMPLTSTIKIVFEEMY